MPVIDAPDYQERVVFAGANGSGKTVLASEMIAGYSRVVILDIKGDFPIPASWRKDSYVITVRPPMGLSNAHIWSRNRIIYRPTRVYRSAVGLTYFLVKMFDRAAREGKKRPFILYLDEGLYTLHKAKEIIRDIAITGRSMGLGLWISVQRLKGGVVEIRSEAWRWYIFFMPGKSDDEEVEDYSKGQISQQDMAALGVDYSFWELRRGKGGRIEARHYPPVAISS